MIRYYIFLWISHVLFLNFQFFFDFSKDLSNGGLLMQGQLWSHLKYKKILNVKLESIELLYFFFTYEIYFMDIES